MSKFWNFNKLYPDGDWRRIKLTPAYNFLWLSKDRKWTWDETIKEYRLFVEGLDEYPWGDSKELPILGKIIFENERFITVEILPHINHNGEMSQPYRHTIHKVDLMNGRFKVEPIEYVMEA